MADFLTPNDEDISPEFAKFIVKVLTRMIVEVKTNFKGNNIGNLNCNNCLNNGIVKLCTQKHLLECPSLIGKNEMVSYTPSYDDIFNENLREKVYICQLINENLKIKKAQV